MKYYRITDDTGAELYVCAADSVRAIYAPHIRSAEQITKEEFERGRQCGRKECEGLPDAVPECDAQGKGDCRPH